VRMKHNLIALLVLIGLVVYGTYEYLRGASPDAGPAAEAAVTGLETGIRKGRLAPDFALEDLQGNTIRLSDFRGKTVLVNFWATWCPPCRAEMPHLQKFYEDYRSRDVVILGVNLTPTEKNADRVREFANERQLTFPVVLDEEGAVMNAYKVVSYPTTFLLDAGGVIREIFHGPMQYDKMKEAVSRIQ